MNELLKWDVFVTPGIPVVISDPPPGTKQLMWSPISSTLIYGKRDAVLVDAFITVEQTRALVDWGRGERQKPDNDLRYARPWRPFLRRQYSSRAISGHPLCCHAGCSQDYAPAGIATVPRVVLESAFPRPDFRSSRDCGRTDRKRD